MNILAHSAILCTEFQSIWIAMDIWINKPHYLASGDCVCVERIPVQQTAAVNKLCQCLLLYFGMETTNLFTSSITWPGLCVHVRLPVVVFIEQKLMWNWFTSSNVEQHSNRTNGMAQDIIRIHAIRRGRNQTEAHHKQTAVAVATKRQRKKNRPITKSSAERFG